MFLFDLFQNIVFNIASKIAIKMIAEFFMFFERMSF